MPDAETADAPEETEQPDDDPQPEEAPEQDGPDGQTPLEAAGEEEDPEEQYDEDMLPDYADDLPPHMVDENGVNTKEVYKSFQGLVRDLDSDVDTDELTDEVFEEDGTINEEELVKKRNELRKKLSQTKQDDEDTDDEKTAEDVPESPEDYTLEIDGETIEGETEDELIEALRESAHSSNMTEEQLNDFINKYTELEGELYGEPDSEEILSELSDDPQQAKKIAEQTRLWVDGLKNRGLLSDEEHQEAVKFVAQTPDGISLLNKLRQLDSDQAIPSDSEVSVGESVNDIESQIQDLMNNEAYFDSGHPDHERVVKQVEKLQEKKIQKQS